MGDLRGIGPGQPLELGGASGPVHKKAISDDGPGLDGHADPKAGTLGSSTVAGVAVNSPQVSVVVPKTLKMRM